MNQIKQIRQALGLTQREFGNGIGVFQTMVSFYEVGKSDPTPDTARSIIRFARSKGFPINYEHVYGDAPVPEFVPAAAQSTEAAQPAGG